MLQELDDGVIVPVAVRQVVLAQQLGDEGLFAQDAVVGVEHEHLLDQLNSLFYERNVRNSLEDHDVFDQV